MRPRRSWESHDQPFDLMRWTERAAIGCSGRNRYPLHPLSAVSSAEGWVEYTGPE